MRNYDGRTFSIEDIKENGALVIFLAILAHLLSDEEIQKAGKADTMELLNLPSQMVLGPYWLIQFQHSEEIKTISAQ